MLQSLKKYLFYGFVLLVLALVIVLTFRVPLINYVLKEQAPEGIQVSIEKLGLHPWSRAVSIGGIKLNLSEPELKLALGLVRLEGIGFDFEPSFSWQQLRLEQLKLGLASGEDVAFDSLALSTGSWSEAQGALLKQLELDTLQVSTAEPELMLNLNRLSIEQIGLDAQQQLTVAQVALTQISALMAAKDDLPEVGVNLERLTLVDIASDLTQTATLGQLGLDNLALDIDAWQWQLALGRFNLEAIKLEDFIGSDDAEADLKLKLAKLALADFDWHTGKDEQALQALLLKSLELEQIALAQNSLAMQSLNIGELQVHAKRDAQGLINLQPPTPESEQSSSANADKTEVAEKAQTEPSAGKAESEQQVSEQAVPQSELQAEQQAELAQVTSNPEAGLQSAPNKAAASDEAEAQAPEMVVTLGQLKLSHPAKLRWQDDSVSPVVDQTLVLNQLQLDGLSTASQDKAADLVLAGVLGLHTAIDLKAKLHPANSPDNMEVELKIAKLELPPFSGYSQQATGYALESGQFNFDLAMQIVKAELGGEAKLDAYNVVMRVEDEAVSERINQELTMPLPTAIYLLEDPDKHIALTMPLKGSLDDPSFSWSGIMRFIMLKAIRKASVYYLKQAILPQTTLVSLVDMFGGMVYNKLTELPPLPYAPTKVDLTKDHKALLDQVAKTMEKKDKLNFRLCATANAADGDKTQALALADQRVANIRGYLSQEKGIASTRLLSCLSKYDSEAEQSGVKIKL